MNQTEELRDQVILHALAAELKVLTLGELVVSLGLDPVVAFQLAGALNLVLRYPDLGEEIADTVRATVLRIAEWFELDAPHQGKIAAPTVARIIRQGLDPEHDRPRVARPASDVPLIILP